MNLIKRNGLAMVFGAMFIICEFYEIIPEREDSPRIVAEAGMLKKFLLAKYGGGGGYGKLNSVWSR